MKVLVVDDEAPARDRLRRMVQAINGCRVCGEAPDGRQALAVASELQPDVILLDIRMPDMDGMEAARHLLALEQPPAVIFTTAYSDYALDKIIVVGSVHLDGEGFCESVGVDS